MLIMRAQCSTSGRNAQHMDARFIGAACHVAYGLIILSESCGGHFLNVSQLEDDPILIHTKPEALEANPQFIFT